MAILLNLVKPCSILLNYYSKPTFKTDKDCLKLVHFNARSLNANFTQIESYISSFEVMLDVITISET